MEVYIVIKDTWNNGDYEDYSLNINGFDGIFSSKDKAVEYIRNTYNSYNDNLSELTVKNGIYEWAFGEEGYASEWTVQYKIYHITELDKSFDKMPDAECLVV